MSQSRFDLRPKQIDPLFCLMTPGIKKGKKTSETELVQLRLLEKSLFSPTFWEPQIISCAKSKLEVEFPSRVLRVQPNQAS